MIALERRARGSSPAETLAVLERDGAVILEDLVSSALMDRIAAELSAWIDRPATESPMGNNRFSGLRTLRTSSLIAKSEGCHALVTDPFVLALAEAVLGPQCSRIQLSFTQAIKIGAGETAQVLHRDSTMYPFRHPGPEVFLNAIWALSDFSADNGATRILPGSHRWPDERRPTREDPVACAEMSRGSVVVYYGSVYHGGGANQTADRERIGIAFGYTLGWLRQEENQYLAVPPEKARTLPVELQRLIGYAEHYPLLGWYEGEDTGVFRGGEARRQYATEVRGGRSKPVSELFREE